MLANSNSPTRNSELKKRLPSGTSGLFYNRVAWAKTYLKQAGLVRATRRGYFELTATGREVLAPGEAINMAYLARFPEYLDFRSRKSGAADDADDAVVTAPTAGHEGDATHTPEERIDAAAEEIHSQLRDDLLQRILDAPPNFPERLVVDLLIAMDYGGAPDTAGRHLGQTADGGVDGVIDQDALGLDQIYVQAKRYATDRGVGEPAIREFVGSLVGRGSNKGVFVTTSYFSGQAKTYAERISQRVVLIDGDALVRLMIQHGVGTRSARSVELKRTDLDYFEPDADA